MNAPRPWWNALYLRHALGRDLLAVLILCACAGPVAPLLTRSGAGTPADASLQVGTVIETPPDDNPLDPAAPASAAADPQPDQPQKPADAAKPPDETTAAEANPPPTETAATASERPNQDLDAAEPDRSNAPAQGPAAQVAENKTPPAPRCEAVETFQPGLPRTEDERRKEQEQIVAFEERLREGRFRLLVDLTLLSREDLARVCVAFRFRTANRVLFLGPSGERLEQADLGRNSLVGDRPGESRIPRAAAAAAHETLGPYHNAAISCLFSDECALTLYKALSRVIDSNAIPPASTFELQLRAASNGRFDAVAVTTGRNAALPGK